MIVKYIFPLIYCMSDVDAAVITSIDDLTRRLSRVEEKIDILLAAIDDLDPEELAELRSTLKELKRDVESGRKDVFYSMEEAFSDV